ncbi:hypothetical protein HD806DRAFT_47379 [Xylariaceae sp. AK1471]|nr:hypothetical protein HD806DRAFT_47379 [Xylariaceae sp. AK1471]
MDDGASPMEAEASYMKLRRKLQSTYRHIDAPASLDQYFHESIDDDDLNTRNGDQVISRFIARQRVRWEDDVNRGAIDTHHDIDVRNTPSQLEEGLGNALQPIDSPTAEPERFCQRIITVPRLWIWMVDESTIVTSFPQSWGGKDHQSLLPRAIWKRLMEATLKKQQAARERAIGSSSAVHLDVDDMLEEIVRACLQFRPSFRLLGREYSFPDIFAAEIAFVSREVTMFYEAYRSSLGSSVEDFSESIKLATECLMKVDDILNEISMIRRVYRDQGRIMLNLRTNEEMEMESDGGSVGYRTSEWGYEGLRSTEDKYIIAKLKHLEKDARMVKESITTLLDLRQRQVTVEMALSSEVQSRTLFRQSSILFIFALATVLITPLSWVSSLMALRIDGFSPDTWPQSRVVAASFGSVLGTVIFCAFGLAVYRGYQDHLMR